jgi:hypothetical protein
MTIEAGTPCLSGVEALGRLVPFASAASGTKNRLRLTTAGGESVPRVHRGRRVETRPSPGRSECRRSCAPVRAQLYRCPYCISACADTTSVRSRATFVTSCSSSTYGRDQRAIALWMYCLTGQLQAVRDRDQRPRCSPGLPVAKEAMSRAPERGRGRCRKQRFTLRAPPGSARHLAVSHGWRPELQSAGDAVGHGDEVAAAAVAAALCPGGLDTAVADLRPSVA